MSQEETKSQVVGDAIVGALRAAPGVHPVFRVDDPELRGLADRLRLLLEAAQMDEVRDPLDYLLGALHALFRARQLEFVDRNAPLDAAYWNGPLTRVRYMQAGDIRTDGKWLAGFYFNAALARIAAALDRIVTLIEVRSHGTKRSGKFWKRLQDLGWGTWHDPEFGLASGEPSKAYRTYAEVNFLKHDPKGRATGRQVSFADAISAFSEVLDLTQQHVRLGAAPQP
jgi:hypothetical protein